MSNISARSLFLLLLLLLSAGQVHSQETATADLAEPTAEPASSELFPIPGGDVSAKLKFIAGLTKRQAPTGNQHQQLAHQIKVARTIIAAADAALKLKPTADQLPQLHFHRLAGFQVLANSADAELKTRFQKELEATLANSNKVISDVGLKFYVSNAFAQWPMLSEQERHATSERIAKYVLAKDPAPNYVLGSIKVADFLAESGDTELAKQFIAATLPHFKNATSAEIAEQANVLIGIQRRINLMGQKIELAGKQLGDGTDSGEPTGGGPTDGEKFDWSQYEGKVVLVDFWATWCGPCRAELPNVSRLYKAYHDKGFEVVGVNLDDNPELAQKFIADKRLPWATLYSFDEQQRGWSDPRAVEFGITGIPFAILLDRDGKVIDMHAREQRLANLLQKELGEPLISLDSSLDSTPQAVTAAKVTVDEAVKPASTE